MYNWIIFIQNSDGIAKSINVGQAANSFQAVAKALCIRPWVLESDVVSVVTEDFYNLATSGVKPVQVDMTRSWLVTSAS